VFAGVENFLNALSVFKVGIGRLTHFVERFNGLAPTKAAKSIPSGRIASIQPGLLDSRESGSGRDGFLLGADILDFHILAYPSDERRL
jgi:hypothetical protein